MRGAAKSKTVTISDSGDGELAWVAVFADPGLLMVAADTGGAGAQIAVAAPSALSFAFYGAVRSAVYIFDVTGTRKAPQVVEVIVQGSEQHLPGDIDGNGARELVDAILALQLAAGLSPPMRGYPDPLGADADGDSKLGLNEALFVLQDVSVRRQ